jgi:hypothetical protein
MGKLEQLCLSNLLLQAPDASRTHSAPSTELGETRSGSDVSNSSSSSNLVGSSISAIGGSSPLSALTHLQIDSCRLASLAWLPALTGLQRLELQRLQGVDSADVQIAAALPQLLQLTSLSLVSYWAAYVVAAAAAASNLSHLQSISLHRIGATSGDFQEPIVLSCLPHSLTSLELIECAVSSSASGDSNSNISSSSSLQLTALQRLVLAEQTGEVVTPERPDCTLAIFRHLTQLQLLDYDAALEPHMQDVLAVLQQLQQLQHLRLRNVLDLDDPTAAEYAALTASSNLTALQLHACSIADAAAEGMFVPRRLPQLQQVAIGWRFYDDMASTGNWHSPAGGAFFASQGYSIKMGPGGLQQVVDCAPALQQLGTVLLSEDVAAGELQALLQLTALTALSIGGAACDDSAAEHVLAKLTGGV